MYIAIHRTLAHCISIHRMNMNRLGGLQENIIELKVECPVESENTNHIGKALYLSQPSPKT